MDLPERAPVNQPCQPAMAGWEHIQTTSGMLPSPWRAISHLSVPATPEILETGFK
jgi:hypothetical protein